MCIRLWFDMAQVRAVVEEETGMWRNAGRAFKLTFSNFGSLFWMYLRISIRRMARLRSRPLHLGEDASCAIPVHHF